MITSTIGCAKRSVVRSGAPARDGRRRLRPWTVTQPWTPRTRPPLLGNRADAVPTPPTTGHVDVGGGRRVVDVLHLPIRKRPGAHLDQRDHELPIVPFIGLREHVSGIVTVDLRRD